MSVETLTLIHELLTEEERQSREAYEKINALYQAPNKLWEIAPLKKQHETAKERYTKAHDALTNFEAQEWKEREVQA